MRLLTPLEARVLGVLVEKQLTVPDTYPLTLNSLLAGCNRKSSRDPQFPIRAIRRYPLATSDIGETRSTPPGAVPIRIL